MSPDGVITSSDGNDLETVGLAFGMMPLSYAQTATALPYQMLAVTLFAHDLAALRVHVSAWLGGDGSAVSGRAW